MRYNSRKNIVVSIIGIMVTCNFGSCLVLAEAKEGVDTNYLKSCVSRSYRGEILEAKIIPESQPLAVLSGVPQSTDSVDLAGMARWGLHYLRNNSDAQNKKHPYRAYFLINLLPDGGAVPIQHSWADICDIELLTLRGMLMARLITGQKQPDIVEKTFLERAVGFIEEELHRMPAELMDRAGENRTIYVPAQQYLIDDLSELYVHTGNQRWKKLGASLIRGLMSQSARKDGCAWLCGMAYSEQNSPPPYSPNGCGPHSWAAPVIRFWEVTGDEEALKYGMALSQSVITRAEPCGELHFNPDGSYTHHVVYHIKNALGVLMAGQAANNAKHIHFAKQTYDYTKSLGADTGWFPEWLNSGHCDHGETCGVGHMSAMAARLGRLGYTECYDDLERFIRNYLRWVQFFITPEYEALYRRRNGDKAEEGLAITRRLQGGFVSSPEVNDLFAVAPGGPPDSCHPGIDMMGCCSPEGVWAIWQAWSDTITHDKRGYYVNMSFNRETSALKVISFAPDKGCLTVISKQNVKAVHLRPPSWTPREMVKAYKNSRYTQVKWWGDYIFFEKVKTGDELTITHPLVFFKQKLSLPKRQNTDEVPQPIDFIQTWNGNTIVDIEPKGKILPIFTGSPPKMPSLSE